jgi:hypothetical protein
LAFKAIRIHDMFLCVRDGPPHTDRLIRIDVE